MPQPRTLVSLAAIALGAISVIMMAHKGFHVRLNGNFVEFLGTVEAFASVAVQPIEQVIVHPLLRSLAALGLVLTVEPHWKYAFVLLWLFFSASARAFGSIIGEWRSVPVMAMSGAYALADGIYTGTLPLAADSVFMSGLGTVAVIGLTLWVLEYFAGGGKNLLASVAGSVAVFVWWFVILLFLHDAKSGLLPFADTGAPGLACLLGFVVATATLMVLATVFFGRDGEALTTRLESSFAQAWLQLLAVFGVATVATWLGHVLA